MEDVERFFRYLVEVVSSTDPGRLRIPFEVAEIYQTVLPYRHHRTALRVETNEDYEMILLRLLAGEGGFASLDPPEAQDALAAEIQEVNPYPGAFREYAAAKVYLNQGAVREMTEVRPAYAPPTPIEPDEEPEDDHVRFAPPTEPMDTLADGPRAPDAATLRMESVADRLAAPGTCASCGRGLPTGRTVRYCPWCGRDARPYVCRDCDADLEPGWSFCVNCGQAASAR